MKQTTVNAYELSVQDTPYTFIQIDESSVEDYTSDDASSMYTLVMVDVSGSMIIFWEHLMKAWNEIMGPVLKGNTKLWAFGDEVYFLRNGVLFNDSDFRHESTNLTGGIYKISEEINKCKEKFIRAILITDGHNSTEETPESAIAKLSVPDGKTVEFYLFALGREFPVECSIALRSHLHNGNSNIPAIFWANVQNHFTSKGVSQLTKEIIEAIENELGSISGYITKKNVCFTFDPPGFLAAGFQEPTTFVHCGEYICFMKHFDDIVSALQLWTKEGKEIQFTVQKKKLDIYILLNNIFRQWNSLIIQEHRKKGKIHHLAFEVMQKMFDKFYNEVSEEMKEVKPNSIQFRLKRKMLKFLDVEYKTLMNQSKKIIGIEETFRHEIELAEGILKTTVKSKYDLKILKMRGRDSDNYSDDLKIFKEIYEKLKGKILSLPEPSQDECCSITMMSPIKDLQDPSFLDLLEEDKFTFMKTFTITGLPIYAPVHSFSQINPWTLCIKNILKSPYAIVSQSTLEMSADVGSINSEENKEIYLQMGNEDSKFNAIIPVYSKNVIKILQPLLKTNIFALMNTFCILKNPFIIDYNVHFAALGCAWFHSVTEYPIKKKRPEFIVNRIEQIVSTARIYTKRKDISLYFDVLLKEPSQALMTESSKLYDGKSVKSESLIKPLFILYLSRTEEHTEEKIIHIFSLLIMEFIGRCLSTKESFPYSKLFSPDVRTPAKQEMWLDNKRKEFCTAALQDFIVQKGPLHEKYFKTEDLILELKEFFHQKLKSLKGQLLTNALDFAEIEHLQNLGNAGNIHLKDLKLLCHEFGISDSAMNALFGYENLFASVHHCLLQKTSKDRLSQEMIPYEKALESVKSKVEAENLYRFRKTSWNILFEKSLENWTTGFLAVHECETVRPMSVEEIVNFASKAGVEVSQENFDKVFKYNAKTGLVRNACMIKGCSFYLKPNRSFNQHISMERSEGFLHQLHKISLKITKNGGKAEDVIETIITGGYESQNGLRIPETPGRQKLISAKDSINSLIQQYGTLLKQTKLQG